MDIAEKLHDTRLIESQLPESALLIQPEVETLRFGNRKHVVRERIAVGELHRHTGDDWQHMRHEAQTTLVHHRPTRWRGEAAFDVLDGNHDIRQISG